MSTPPQGVQHLADGEQADGDGNEVDAVDQFDGSEGVAPFSAADVDADGADREADQRRQRAQQLVAAEDHDNGEQSRHHDQEVFGRPECLGECGGHRRGNTEKYRADGARNERADGRHHECGPGPALLSKRIAVESTCHRCGFTWCIDQHRGDGSAVHRAVVDRRQHHDRAGRVEPERDRKQDRQSGGWSHPGDDADDHADQHPADEQKQILHRQQRGEAGHQVGHDAPLAERQNALRQTDIQADLQCEVEEDGNRDSDDHRADVVLAVEEPEGHTEEQDARHRSAQHTQQRDEHRGRDDEGDQSQGVSAEVGFGGLLRGLDLVGAVIAGREKISRTAATTMTAIAVTPRIRGKKPGPIRPAAVRHSIPIAISV